MLGRWELFGYASSEIFFDVLLRGYPPKNGQKVRLGRTRHSQIISNVRSFSWWRGSPPFVPRGGAGE